MEKFVPDMYQKNIYAIDYEALKKRGIKCIIFDLDNTLVPPKSSTVTKKLAKHIDDLYDLGFKVIIMSNNYKKRIAPVKEKLRVDALAFSMKPLKSGYKKILKRYRYDVSEIIMIGDQILTDIYGGNKVGITTLLVNPVSTHDDITWTKVNRVLERYIMKKLTKRGLFEKGKYYE